MEKNKKFGGYISKLIFNCGEEIDVKDDEIVVFVGGNNVGKSQALREIYRMSDNVNEGKSVILSDIKIEKYDEDTEEYIKSISKETDYSFEGYNYDVFKSNIKNWKNDDTYKSMRNIFVSTLSTEKRLLICNPVKNINRNLAKTEPLHYMAFDKEIFTNVKEDFKKTFGENLILNRVNGEELYLNMGERVKIDENDEDPTMEYSEKISLLPEIHKQGDGMRSFLGILINLYIPHYRTFLIDEPESFLHPPQARIMGRIIGKNILKEGKQGFISTHSYDFLQGIMEVSSEKIKIIKIDRDNDDNNTISLLKNESYQNIMRDTLMKNSNILSGIFYKNVVLCESDSDCQFYSTINSYLKEKEGLYSESLFIHCGGKQRMWKVIKALKSLSIQVKIIADIDVLNSENEMKRIVEASDGKWVDFEKNLKILNNDIKNNDKVKKNGDVKKKLEKILEELDKKSDKEELDKDVRRSIKDLLEKENGWKAVKDGGIGVIPRGEATAAFKEINKGLKKLNIYVVGVGELECFVKEISGHGSDWVNEVLEKYYDLSDVIYEKAKAFVRSLDI